MSIATMLTVLPALHQLRKREHWTREQLEVHQAQTVSQLREYVYKHSPFYQRLHQGLMDRPLCEHPVLTKTMMMEKFDNLALQAQSLWSWNWYSVIGIPNINELRVERN